MSKQVITIQPNDKVSTAMEKMTNHSIMRMPVVSATGNLVGFIALSDIERAVKILRNRKLNSAEAIICPNCRAPLPLTISRTVTCQHCGHLSSV